MIVEMFVVHYEDGTHTIYGDTRSAEKAAAEGGGCVERFAPEAPLRAQLRAYEGSLPLDEQRELLVQLRQQGNELEELRGEVARLTGELVATKHDAGRMHYLGNVARPKEQAEWDELRALMRKYPPVSERLEKEKADG